MAQALASVNVQAAGVSLTSSITRTADNALGFDPAIAVAKIGQLTTRTDNETGTLTMSSGHGITTGQVIDIYWSGGARYGVLVGTVATNSVPIGADDAGTGDNLPTNLTNVTVQVQNTLNCAIDGDNVSLAAVKLEYTTLTSTGKGRIGFYDADDDLIASIDLDANSVQIFDITGGATNIFTGDAITYAKFSHSDSTNAATLKLAVLQDSTP